MILKKQLCEILKANDYSEDVINQICEKRIKSLLKNGKSTEIESIIKILKKENIDIRRCLSVLERGKTSEIESIIKILKKENIDVRNCLSILAFGKASEIEFKIKLLKDENIDVKDCLSILAKGKVSEIESIIKVLKKENIDVRNCLSVLAFGKASEIESIIKVLKKENIDVRNCLSVLAFGKASEIESIIKILKEEEIEVKNCSSIFAKGKTSEIESIIKILKEEGIEVKNCLSVLAFGKASEIESIIKVLKKENIDVRNCLSILAKGKTSEIESIIKILKEENIDVKGCLKILAEGKSSEIQSIIKILKKENIEVRDCLSILARGKSNEIKSIIKILKKENIEIRNCLSILAKRKASEIEAILKILEAENVNMKYLNDNVSLYRIFILNNAKTIANLFDGNYECKDKKEQLSNLKFYLILKQQYNRFYNFDEIRCFCERRQIDIELFFNIINLNNGIVNEMVKFYEKHNDKKVWIGKSFPMNKSQLEKYQVLIIDIARRVANYCRFLYKIDKSDLEDEVIDILMNKAGGIFNNCAFNETIMEKCLFNYSKKSLKIFTNSNGRIGSIEDYDRNLGESDNYVDDDIEEMGFYADGKFDESELNFLRRLNELLSCGYSMESLMEELNLNPMEYNDMLKNIQQKILKK